jgi:hypothetical protein
LGGVLDKDVGMAVGVAGAAHAVLEGHRHQPPSRLVAVSAVVVAPHPEAMALHIADREHEGLGPSFGQQPPHPWAAGSGQQRHALGAGEAVVEGLHPLIDPLTPVLPRLVEPLPVQFVGVTGEDLAAQPLDRLDLDPPGGASRQAACTERTSPLSALDPAKASKSGASCSAARALRASSSGPAASFDLGSARHSGPHRCSPVAGSSPWNIARTCSGEATPTKPLAAAAEPTNRPGDSPRPEKYSSRLRAIWSSQ